MIDPAAPARGRWPEDRDEQIHPSIPWNAVARFGRRAPLEVEIGSGKARFLTAAAARQPDHDFLGLELSLAYFRVCRDRVARSGLPNVAVVRADARRFVETSLPETSVAAFHVYFPDPWPKKRHRKRRLLDGVFLDVLARRLLSGGLLRIATDHADYGAGIALSIETVPLLERLAWDALPLPPATHYEIKYSAEGRTIWRYLLRRKPD